MNIVFFGSSQFAVPSLEVLIKNGYQISCVVTQPDRQKGRGLVLTPTAIKKNAQGYNLKIYQPERINSEEAIIFLKNLNSDLFVVISYGQILSQGILDIPRIFSVNVHASVLPGYRGAAPINWAIINQEKTTGITIMQITQEMDAGPIILQKKIEIKDDDTSPTLENKLSLLGADLLVESLRRIKNNDYKLEPQDDSRVTLAPKLKKQDGLIDWAKDARSISGLIRGCLNWPGAFTHYRNKLLKIYKAKIILKSDYSAVPKPGEIIQVSREGVRVAAGEDSLLIEELQIEGKKIMKAEEFIAGYKIKVGEILDKLCAH